MVWLVAIVIQAMCDPLTKVSDDILLQRKVPPDLQGRVFGAQSVITQVMIPFAPLIGGYLGDRVFEPVMQTQSTLANFFGPLVGTGPGSGMGLLGLHWWGSLAIYFAWFESWMIFCPIMMLYQFREVWFQKPSLFHCLR
jgi:hypothetical protein